MERERRECDHTDGQNVNQMYVSSWDCLSTHCLVTTRLEWVCRVAKHRGRRLKLKRQTAHAKRAGGQRGDRREHT